MPQSEHTITPFYEDVYLYDLNAPELPPLAYRSARGGVAQPDLLSLIELPLQTWSAVAAQLYRTAVYLSAGGGAVLLPLFGNLGRFVLVVKTSLSVSALAYVYRNAGQRTPYADALIEQTAPALSAREQQRAQSAVRTVAVLQSLIDDCECVRGVYDAADVIERVADLMGVSLLPQEKAEEIPLHEQGILPDAEHAGQVLLVCVMTLLSVMRNAAHARSGWLYAAPCEGGYTLQSFLRCAQDTDPDALVRLRAVMENGGVAVGVRMYSSPVKPPKQYAYMHRKITDAHKPLCAKCGCLDKRCATCMAVQWAVLPFVCDAALLGIKAEPLFRK